MEKFTLLESSLYSFFWWGYIRQCLEFTPGSVPRYNSWWNSGSCDAGNRAQVSRMQGKFLNHCTISLWPFYITPKLQEQYYKFSQLGKGRQGVWIFFFFLFQATSFQISNVIEMQLQSGGGRGIFGKKKQSSWKFYSDKHRQPFIMSTTQ